MRVTEGLVWQSYCTTTGTCCLARYGTKYMLVRLLVMLWHVEELCFIHQSQVDISSLQSKYPIRSVRNHSCPEHTSEIAFKQCFSSPVMFALRVLHNRTRISQIPDDHCLFLSMQYNLALCARCHLSLVTLPLSARVPLIFHCRIVGSPNNIPLIILHHALSFSAAD